MGMITIPGYKGGYTNDLFAPLNSQTFQKAQDLDIYTHRVLLKPLLNLASDATNQTLSAIDLTSAILASDGRVYFKGFGTDGNTTTIWDAGLPVALSATTALTAEITAAGNANVHDMVEFLSNLFYFQTTSVIQRFDFSTITADVVTGVSSQAPIFVHEGLKKIFYTVAASQIGGSITTSLTNSALITFGNDMLVVQMAPFKQFVCVGTRTAGSKTSKLVIWDGSSNTIEDLIDIGDTGLQGIANVNDSIYAITASNPNGFSKQNIIRIFRWRGGRISQVAEIDLKSTVNNAASVAPRSIAVDRNKLLFGVVGSTAGVQSIDGGVWVYDDTKDILNLERMVEDTTTMTIRAIDIIEGQPMVMWFDGANFKLNHVLPSSTISARGIYQSNAFLINNGKEGTIKRILIHHKPIPTSCGFTVKLKHIGHYPSDGSVASEDSFTVLPTPQGSGGSTGKTQSTDNAAYTIIETPDLFKKARFAQIEIDWDEVNGTDAAEIYFPIFIETIEGSDRI